MGRARTGTGGEPLACRRCRTYWLANREALARACAQVGLEHGKSAGALLVDYLQGYHQAGHREDRL